ncbi:MAG: hypoxanthine phosphoribosyltransferase [Thermoleophilia bacterium]|nr:hypoxanthine phosphoribosyltransferase [Thermoleophilia bacterium]
MGPVVYDGERIGARVRELGANIDADYAGRVPVLVTVLTGATMFAADLTRAMNLQHEMDFLAVSAYGSAEPGDSARVLKDLQVSVANRDVILVEDVIDTGLTLSFILRFLETHEPRSLEVCTLLDRPQRRLVECRIKYRGFTVPDRFLVGYGFDHRQKYRNLPDLHELMLTAEDRERLLSGS